MQKNENRPGYKKTKVGWIPHEWECGALSEIVSGLKAGVSVNSDDSPAKENEFGVLKTSAVTYGIFDVTANKRILKAELSRAKISPKKGSVIISRMNTPTFVGANSYIDKDYPNLKLPDRLWMMQVKNTKENHPRWLGYLMSSPHMRFTLSNRATGTSGSMKNITKGDVLSIQHPKPSQSEQEGISEVLECWDKAIRELESKIEKKRNIKKGLMQVLLSGERRLPGFGTTEDTGKHEKGKQRIPSGWKEIRMGKLGQTYSGLTGKTKEDFGTGKSFIPYMNIYSNSSLNIDALDKVTIISGENQNRAQYGDLFFTTSSETPEEVGVSSVLLQQVNELYLNSFCFGFRMHNFNTLLPEFTKHYFRGAGFRKAMFRIAQGASRYNLSKKYFLQTKIIIPTDIAEQKAIAGFLSAADSEIGGLERKLAGLREQKRYLLNNLVTGTIRLPQFRPPNKK